VKREVSLDSWRGLMLVVMATSHLGGALGASVRQLLGYVSAAEGFVFLSGVMCGLVYGRYAEVDLALMRRRTWARAWTIYRYHLGTLVILLGVIMLMHAMPGDLAAYYRKTDLAAFVDDPALGLIASALLLLQPIHFDILALYVLYMALAPLMLALFARGRAASMFIASIALWLFAQAGGSELVGEYLPSGPYLRMGTFDPFAWQVLFVAGGYFGWRRASGKPVLPRIPDAIFYGACTAALLLFLLRHGVIELSLASYIDEPFALVRLRLGWLRLVNVALVAFVIYSLAMRYGIELRNSWLALLGGHSLQVYAFHALVLYLAIPIRWRINAMGEVGELLFALAFLASLTVPAVIHQRYRLAAAGRSALKAGRA
jgi:hypothetical protein